jgi:alanine dehydrogenase
MLIGLPRMHKEAAELRDFLPDFVAFLAHRDAVTSVLLEHEYGCGIGFSERDYGRVSPKIKFGSYDDCLAQDIVIVLRSPAEEALGKLRPGAILLSMLHYSTNPKRNEVLIGAGITAVSLDSLVDDRGSRLVENVASVGWNGMEIAFAELARTLEHFDDPARDPIVITILGSGGVAGAAAFAAARYGDQDVRARMIARRVRGVEVTLIDHDLTWDLDYVGSRLARSDMLVDATRRPDPSTVIIPNAVLAELPPHSVILDLAADPYDFRLSPPIVKGVEGVPHGDLDHFVFPVSDPAYEDLARHVDVSIRRVALSCYSWPGIHPRMCMEHYGAQLEPFVDVLTAKPPGSWSLGSDNHVERALVRAEVDRWMERPNASR